MLTADEKLRAISWKCRETGLSYGSLVGRYTPDELNAIYAQYESILLERRAREAKRLREQKQLAENENGEHRGGEET